MSRRVITHPTFFATPIAMLAYVVKKERIQMVGVSVTNT